MKQAKYRVETYIVPLYNKSDAENSERSVTVKEESRLVHAEKHDADSTEDEALQNLRNSLIVESINDIDSTRCRKVDYTLNNYNRYPLPVEAGVTDSKELSRVTDKLYSLNLPEQIHGFGESFKSTAVTDISYPSSFSNDAHSAKAPAEKLRRVTDVSYPASFFRKMQTLKSIDERSEEYDEKLTDLCHHGCKYGCSVTVPSPQEVSAEAFKDNWLQRLEEIKQKETALRTKELLIEERERALVKRETDIRIMEWVLKEGITRAEAYLKLNKNRQDSLNPNNPEENASQLKPNVTVQHRNTEINKSSDLDAPTSSVNDEESKKGLTLCIQIRRPENPPEIADTNFKESLREESATSASMCSTEANYPEEKRAKKQPNLRNSAAYKSLRASNSKFSSSSNERSRKPCKISYEDLDTTLSADIGDSSFVQTSRMFNPALYRRPFSFGRSNSERYPRHAQSRDSLRTDLQGATVSKEQSGCPFGIEQDRILRRVTKNISASQDKTTKFQNYGLIDVNVNGTNKTDSISRNLKEDRKYSYLNLEIGTRSNLEGRDKVTKERPISWNGGTNQWLLKKRHAYNTTTRKMAADENKENAEKSNAKANKSKKLPKKKDVKNKIFTVFWS